MASAPAAAAPYAAMVMDARNGKVLHSRNADTRLHPASLTKMMTLYVVFDAVERGEISLDTKVTISRFAASEPPSKLGLKPGQKIALRYLIRAAAVKSANDAATALGEAISGSEAAFARRMNRMAKELGMTRTTFRNAHGLTESGHLSTARDMTNLGRHLFYDFPEYYNLFSRRSTHAGIKSVNNTNRRLLGAYRGADGIKTGYTRAAGYNLVASAERGRERVIATVFGGRSGAWRNQRVAELLDMGFSRAPSQVAVVKPRRGTVSETGPALVAGLPGAIPRPPLRSATGVAVAVAGARDAIRAGVEAALAEAAVTEAAGAAAAASLAAASQAPATDAAVTAALSAAAPQAASAAGGAASASLASGALQASLRPPERPLVAEGSADPDSEIVSRPVEGARHWSIAVGRYTSRHEAEKALVRTALVEIGTLDGARRRVVQSASGFEATFGNLSQERAALACERLAAQAIDCTPQGPGSDT